MVSVSYGGGRIITSEQSLRDGSDIQDGRLKRLSKLTYSFNNKYGEAIKAAAKNARNDNFSVCPKTGLLRTSISKKRPTKASENHVHTLQRAISAFYNGEKFDEGFPKEFEKSAAWFARSAQIADVTLKTSDYEEAKEQVQSLLDSDALADMNVRDLRSMVADARNMATTATFALTHKS